MTKHVLVTGSKGLIGTRFFQLFSDTHELISGDLDDGFDVLEPSSFDKVIAGKSVSAIVHLAAFTDVSGAYCQRGDESGLCYRLNVTATENVVNLANRLGAHLVHISTDFVFSGEHNSPMAETDTPEPIEWYGETKLRAEQIVAEQTDAWTTIRIAFPFLRKEGVRPDLVANITNKLTAGEPLYLFGDQIITPTFADDVANAIARMIKHTPHGETYHVMGPEFTSPFELGCTVAECRNVSAEKISKTSLIEYLQKDPRPRQQYMAMDTSKYRAFCEQHGYEPPVSVKKALGLKA